MGITGWRAPETSCRSHSPVGVWPGDPPVVSGRPGTATGPAPKPFLMPVKVATAFTGRAVLEIVAVVPAPTGLWRGAPEPLGYPREGLLALPGLRLTTDVPTSL